MIIKILLLVSSVHLGDVGQATATIKALSADIAIEVFDIDASKHPEEARLEYLDKVKTIPKDQNYITLAIGESGMELLEYLSDNRAIDNSRSYTCLSIHQYFYEFEKLKLDHIILPESTINTIEKDKLLENISNINLILTPLTNNPSVEELKTSYNNWLSPEKPSLNDKYIIIMLPGDAPDSSNKMHYFTKDSAKELFQYVYKLWEEKGKKYKILIQNGPRTGKFDPETGKIVNKHEYSSNQDPSIAIDDISAYFVKLFSKMDHSFFNFAFEIKENRKEAISSFNPLLYLARQNDNIFILPGASVSLIGQIPQYLPPDRIILFEASSMNKNHQSVFQLAFERNYLSYFSSTGEVIMPAKLDHGTENDSKKIAKDIITGYMSKSKLEK